jgi:hypothetical protein
VAGNQLRNTGPDVAFGGREGGAGKDIVHLLHNTTIQDKRQKSSPKHNTKMRPLQLWGKNQLKRMWN